MHVYACVNEIWKTRVEAQRVQLLTAPLDRKVNSFFFSPANAQFFFVVAVFIALSVYVCMCVYVLCSA